VCVCVCWVERQIGKKKRKGWLELDSNPLPPHFLMLPLQSFFFSLHYLLLFLSFNSFSSSLFPSSVLFICYSWLEFQMEICKFWSIFHLLRVAPFKTSSSCIIFYLVVQAFLDSLFLNFMQDFIFSILLKSLLIKWFLSIGYNSCIFIL